MVVESELIASLKRLSVELETSGKSGTSRFFGDIAEQLDGDIDSIDVIEILDKLVHSGSIALYANLSSSEDLIYEGIHKYAVDLRESFSEGT